MCNLVCLSLLLVALSARGGLSLVLTSSSPRIRRNGSPDFSMKCATTPDDMPGNSPVGSTLEVHRMRILKLEAERWNTLMEMDSDWSAPKVRKGLKGKARIEESEDGFKFLQVTWSLATNHTAGMFSCDVMGFADDGQGVYRRSPSLFVDMEIPISLYDMIRMVHSSNKRVDEAMSQMSYRMDNAYEALENLIQENSNAIAELKNQEKSSEEAGGQKGPKSNENSDLEKDEEGGQNGEDTTEVAAESKPVIPRPEKIVEVEKTTQRPAGEKETEEDVLSGAKPSKGTSSESLASEGTSSGGGSLEESEEEEGEEEEESTDDNAEGAGSIEDDENTTDIDEIQGSDLEWPRGTYGLLSPVSGCPRNKGVTWETGWRKHHTESTLRNRDRVSKPAHMLTEFESYVAQFMIQHFCTVVKNVRRNPEWPAGTYCINKRSKCPEGFDYGYVHWDDEDTDNQNAYDGELPSHSFGNTFSRIFYCCRNDSSHDTTIRLPRHKPFYLYQYQGRCQKVEGMKSTQEFMVFNTNCCGSRFEPYTPDGKDALPEVRLDMCYYQRDDGQKAEKKAPSNVIFP